MGIFGFKENFLFHVLGFKQPNPQTLKLVIHLPNPFGYQTLIKILSSNDPKPPPPKVLGSAYSLSYDHMIFKSITSYPPEEP
jgi:hypothetical protein